LLLATVVTSFGFDVQLKLHPYKNDVIKIGSAGRWKHIYFGERVRST